MRYRKAILKSTRALILFLILTSCIQHKETNVVEKNILVEDTIVVKYAQGFEVNYRLGYLEVISHSIGENSFFADTVFLKTDSWVAGNEKKKFLNPDLKTILCQSSTHLAFIELLEELDRVKGLCGLEYVQNAGIAAKLEKNQVQEICQAENTVMEEIQKLNPDLFLIYPFETSGKEKYTANGINTFYIAEYLEELPLARLEWIKLFGILLNKTDEANAYFDKVEAEYNDLRKNETDTSKKFILNLPFKDNWHMPSANSLIVQLIEDAGLTYYYSETGSTENDLHSKEAVWNDAMYADYWIIMANRPADFTLDDLVSEEAVYSKFKPVLEGNVIFCNTSTTDYFSSGVVEPHVMLKDFLYATGQIKEHEPKYFSILR